MKKRLTTVTAVLFLLVPMVSSVCGDPLLIVNELGVNGMGNREWGVQIVPDVATLPDALNVELAFEVTEGTLVGADIEETLWPFNDSHPGFDPFTGSVGFGLNVNTTAGTVFAALGSDPFASAGPFDVMTIETFGSGATTLSWGGHALLPGTPNEFIGSRISQNRINYDGYMGELSAGGGGMVDGDFNGDTVWDCADINALTAAVSSMSSDLAFDMNSDGFVTFADISDETVGWLAVGGANSTMTGGNAYLSGDANLDGVVDVSDFNVWNANKFETVSAWCSGDFNADGVVDVSDFNIWNSFKFQSSAGSAVPEPSAVLMLLAAVPCLVACRRRNGIR